MWYLTFGAVRNDFYSSAFLFKTVFGQLTMSNPFIWNLKHLIPQLCAILFGMPAMVASKSPKDIEDEMKFFQIIHDVISVSPPAILNVK